MGKQTKETVQGARITTPSIIIGLDPGKWATGFCEIHMDPTMHVVRASRLSNEELWDRLRDTEPGNLVVCEGFRLYKWSAQDLVGSDFMEIRNIGRIEEICTQTLATLWIIPAAAHKQAVSDDFLRLVGAWSRNEHTMDGIRAATYGYLRW